MVQNIIIIGLLALVILLVIQKNKLASQLQNYKAVDENGQYIYPQFG